MKPTPETDALASDPAIERRDVPTRVWRTMAEIERQRDEAREQLDAALAAVDQFANSAEAHADGTDFNPACSGCRSLLKKHAAIIALARQQREGEKG